MAVSTPANPQNPAALGTLSVREVVKRFGEVAALRGVSLEIEKGEFFTLLGPSGCGKTTLLRIIAGFELPDEGKVWLNGADISSWPANRRPINTVFQSYALFPHLNVFENVAFGLKSRRFPKDLVERRVEYALGLLQIESFASRYPHQLSGGQKQRVAMARALVNEPEVLLLDEPMSALDAKLRAEVQVGLRRLQRSLGTTFILVTHDQDEAMTVSDRIAVMREGQVVQVGSPEEVYAEPKTRFVAEFLGTANLIPAKKSGSGAETPLGHLQVARLLPWSEGTLAIRPERVQICPTPPPVNGVAARVRDVVYRGSHQEVWLEPGNLRVRAAPYPALSPGQEVWAGLPPEGLVVLDD